ncbi:glycosyltransferase family 4 protein [Natronorubrum sp. A-ect3]|uniref:glycosyltransferase family 4 protein n=1 Tax=Natronorubrum sp. A-ect3 TaxID=3242698 RepID=UPI00359CC18D
MTIYYLSTADLPSKRAHSIQQMKMCDSFVESGEELEFICPSYTLYKENHTSWSHISGFYDVKNEFNISKVRSFKPGGSLPARIFKKGVQSGMINLRLLYYLLSKEIDNTDVIYSRSFYSTILLSNWFNILPDSISPKIIYEHHNPYSQKLEKHLCENVDGVVFITEKLKNVTKKNTGIDDGKCFVAPDGVDLRPYQRANTRSRNSLRKELDLPLSSKIVAYTGHLYPRKGPQILTRAAVDIDAEVYIIGGYKEDLTRLKSNSPNCDNINYTGFVEPNKVHKYQLASDVLIAPYTTDAWMPSPLKLFEYMAAGKPIVASGIDVIKEVLDHRNNALLVDPEDSSQLANAIQQVLSNEELSKAISKNAKKNVQQYSWDNRANNILNFISNI